MLDGSKAFESVAAHIPITVPSKTQPDNAKRQVVFAVITDVRTGEILMQHRKFPIQQQCWGLPGGRVDPGETLEEAVLREVEEETGFRFARATELFQESYDDTEVTIFIIPVHGTPKPIPCRESLAMGWFSLNNLPRLLHPKLRQQVPKIRKMLNKVPCTGFSKFLKQPGRAYLSTPRKPC